MHPVHVLFLHLGFVGFTFVILAFILFVPFYRTIIGWILFGVKVNFWLILLLAVLLQYGVEPHGVVANILRSILYPATAFSAFALLTVVLRAQIVGRKDHRLETHLFNRTDTEPRS